MNITSFFCAFLSNDYEKVDPSSTDFAEVNRYNKSCLDTTFTAKEKGWSMYYELYVDVLFFVNFFMDYILLLFVWRVLRCEVKHKNIVIGAGAGAFLTCVLVILPIPNTVLELILFHLVVNTCMVRVGLKIKNIPGFFKALILLYIGAFFMGGILESLNNYMKIGGIFILLAVAGYYASLGMWEFLTMLHRWKKKYVNVELQLGDNKIKLNALIDTGNTLRDSETGKPVSVISRSAMEQALDNQNISLRYIPYRSIGKSEGSMPVIQADKLRLLGEEQKCFEKPIIGIAEEAFPEGGVFQMILNPNLF